MLRREQYHNPTLSVAEAYEWAWDQKVDLSGKALLLVLADNGGWCKNLKELCDELRVVVPNFKIHTEKLRERGLIHKRVGGGWVLDIAVDDQRDIAA